MTKQKIDDLLKKFTMDRIAADGLKRTEIYRRGAGILGGFDGAQEEQKVDIDLKYKNGKLTGNVEDAMFSALMKRYDIFGPYYQFPRTFFVGKGVLSSMSLIPEDDKPSIRDIDRLIFWGGKYLGVRSYVHSDFSEPGTVFTLDRSIGEGSIDRDSFNESAERIEDEVFELGRRRVESRSHVHQEIEIENQDFPWILLSYAEGYSRDRAFMGGPSIKTVKKMASIGNVGYVVPSDPAQKGVPVPIGQLNFDRLNDVRKHLMNAHSEPIESSSTAFLDILELGSDNTSDWDVESSSDSDSEDIESFFGRL